MLCSTCKILEFLCKMPVFLLIMLITLEVSTGSKPQFETNLQYSDSYLPAAMQLVAHLTDSMKYDLRPSTPSSVAVTTTTSPRPTPAHKPGLFQPSRPPYVNPYFLSHQYDTKLFETSFFRGSEFEQLQKLESLTTEATVKIKEETQGSEDLRLLEFIKNYAQEDALSYLLNKAKRVPPTRAYVTLLSLYDLMQKEAKRLTLNKYAGYSEHVLRELHASSELGSSSEQLELVLGKLEVADRNLESKVNNLLVDLKRPDSYINLALKYIPPLVFNL